MRYTRLIFVLLVAAGCTCASAQPQRIAAEQVPAAVKSTFTAHFPDVKKVSWRIAGGTEYAADFRDHTKKCSGLFDALGNWMRTATRVEPDALPDAVKRTLAKFHADERTGEAELVEEADRDPCYEVELLKGKERRAIQFDAEGRELRVKTEEEKDEEDND